MSGWPRGEETHAAVRDKMIGAAGRLQWAVEQADALAEYRSLTALEGPASEMWLAKWAEHRGFLADRIADYERAVEEFSKLLPT